MSMSQIVEALDALDETRRDELFEILDAAVSRLPAAEAAIRSSASGAARTADARQLQDDSIAFTRLIDRLDKLAIPRPLRQQLHGILDYHRELIGQAPLFAFGQQSERNAPQRAALADGFGERSDELVALRDRLGGSTPSEESSRP
jgi:hypothetical protein